MSEFNDKLFNSKSYFDNFSQNDKNEFNQWLDEDYFKNELKKTDTCRVHKEALQDLWNNGTMICETCLEEICAGSDDDCQLDEADLVKTNTEHFFNNFFPLMK